MRFHILDPSRAVLELDYTPSNVLAKPEAPLELELHIWWGGGEPTRAAWLWSQTGRVAAWAEVGQA